VSYSHLRHRVPYTMFFLNTVSAIHRFCLRTFLNYNVEQKPIRNVVFVNTKADAASLGRDMKSQRDKLCTPSPTPGSPVLPIILFGTSLLRSKTEPVFVNVYVAQESIPRACVAWRAGTKNRVVVPAR
jgi:hypothetical protein